MRYYATMPLDDALANQITQELRADEGVRTWPYDDATGSTIRVLPTGGNLTIGIGRNLSARPLSPDEVDYLLRNDLRLCYQAAKQVFPDFDSYTQNRRAALLGLLFNLGPGTFVTFKNTIRAIREGRWADAATNLLASRWATQIQPSRRDRVVKQIREG